MSITNRIDELNSKRSILEQGGGPDRVKKQHQSGKLTARERIDLLLDEGSFVEIDAFVKHRAVNFGMDQTETPSDGVVTGCGTIDSRLVYVYSQDFTVVGGTLGEMHAKKITKVMDMALKMGAPIIGINDSGGARIQEGIDALCGYGEIFYRNTIVSGVIPQISVIMGPCAGGAVYSPAITDFIFMVENTSQMFITGPSVIKAVTGEDISSEELGGAFAHNSKSGVAHFRSPSEEECLMQVKRLVSFLPSNNLSDAPTFECSDDLNRLSQRAAEVVPESPGKAYDMKDVIVEVIDDGDFMEVQSDFAVNIITGFGRMNGKTVGIVANQPRILAGSIDVDSSDKAARFIRFCDSFNIPIITFVDTPGYLPGVSQEYGGIIRHGAKLLYAYSEATVPKVTVILRKAYGGAYIAMCSKHLGADMVFAWPSAEIAVMGPEGAANIIFKKEIANSEDPAAKRREMIEEYRNKFSNPYIAASRGYIDDIIDPQATRPSIIASLQTLESKRENRPPKKHGNIPV